MKCGKFLDQLRTCQLLVKDCSVELVCKHIMTVHKIGHKQANDISVYVRIISNTFLSRFPKQHCLLDGFQGSTFCPGKSNI